ncbi:LysR family transcriptional regulator [Allosediminivita pacifica]|uniref:DNA-binding transcriptional LysR family regulator n=1 Tax=Allosediminivita pacifica TaxID=1267769 RepID=A0A2T6AUK8_9RHOB|nr:LysR family transcriptional regulator [Allosediminivita pacifica]PTX47495.1 DNA-binding transcriptional LysR family regulator [Allosediminivita pacifica]GGB14607.1 LysR family transcriptional regulator [Allosediminivita pacifica]
MSDKADYRTSNALVRKGLKFSQLRLLVALRDLGQIGAAAHQVGLTQPAASRLMAQLEELSGVALYTRHARGVVLTEAGRVLAQQAASTLQGLDLANERIGQLVRGARGLVRVGSVTGPSLELLLPVLREARLAYPEIELAVEVGTSDRLSDLLLNRELDFYIGRIPERADAGVYELDVIGPEPISLVVRLGHPLVRQDRLQLRDCLDYDWVTQPPGGLLRRTAETFILKQGLPLPKRVLGTSSTLFTLAMLNETNAIAPLARAVADFFIARGALGSRLARLPVAEDMQVGDFGLVRRAGEAVSPATERLLEMLRGRVAAAQKQ